MQGRNINKIIFTTFTVNFKKTFCHQKLKVYHLSSFWSLCRSRASRCLNESVRRWRTSTAIRVYTTTRKPSTKRLQIRWQGHWLWIPWTPADPIPSSVDRSRNWFTQCEEETKVRFSTGQKSCMAFLKICGVLRSEVLAWKKWNGAKTVNRTLNSLNTSMHSDEGLLLL